jgi:hypothetical protein
LCRLVNGPFTLIKAPSPSQKEIFNEQPSLIPHRASLSAASFEDTRLKPMMAPPILYTSSLVIYVESAKDIVTSIF